jgi:hypothetical protein
MQVKIHIKCKCAFVWDIEEVFDVQESTEIKTLKQRRLFPWRNLSSREGAVINNAI